MCACVCAIYIVAVPEYKPEAALYMFTAFLNNDEYAPPLDVHIVPKREDD